ncbi:aminodeoxychorismate synthase component I [Hansschlegelia beijingensis]|uniref:aminodeoxychorismate synthase n=1 Tax=Hansschlegelia beijingensis TaxID=1133344 RepID=A0A7W6GFS6_9HYPH|nr:aminodeoxychorismate synthase component I [Hansschlegelia beijingensis]MBB3973413.1 para-aminobenzoate synthetase component 1 [Hansschlegelia beijingensis]
MQVHELPTIDMPALAERLAGLPHLVFLDSAMPHAALGRYSYLAADPYAVLDARDGGATLGGEPVADALVALDRALDAARAQRQPDLPPFQGGAAGFVSYEFGRRLERLPAPEVDDLGVPDLVLPLYDWVVACDHARGKAWLISTGAPAPEGAEREARARSRAEQALEWLSRPAPARKPAAPAPLSFSSNFDRAAYEAAIARTVEYVLAGDIFQANVAQRFLADLPEGFDPWAFYRRLRTRNAAPFAAYLDFGDVVVASSSPERFVRVEGDQVEARPIKGTAKRWTDPIADGSSSRALLGSEKDRAENVMIVDLLRNDLSRVCRPGTVEVPTLCGLETYASVHHLVSVVTGRLREGLGVVDLLRASFPGGSITGAPKLRAMEIITEIERHARGVYCGSIGWIGFTGDADFNIAIRTATLARGKALFQAGGGITALSDPAAEYDETLTKARAVFDAFGGRLAEQAEDARPFAAAGGLR